MADSHVAAIELIMQAINWDGQVRIKSALDGNVKNAGVERYMQLNHRHLEEIEVGKIGEIEGIYLQVRTNQSHLHVAQAARTRIYLNGKEPSSMENGIYQEHSYIARVYTVQLCKNQPLIVEKVITFYTSKDHAISECGLEARCSVMRLESFDELLKSHQMAWRHMWRRFDIEIDYDEPKEEISKFLRLHIFHLLQTISMHSKDLDCGVPPRGWHGEAYRGHILWDEVFIFPP